MRGFLLKWAVAAAGVALFERVTRPPAAGGLGVGWGGWGRLREPAPIPEPAP